MAQKTMYDVPRSEAESLAEAMGLVDVAQYDDEALKAEIEKFIDADDFDEKADKLSAVQQSDLRRLFTADDFTIIQDEEMDTEESEDSHEESSESESEEPSEDEDEKPHAKNGKPKKRQPKKEKSVAVATKVKKAPKPVKGKKGGKATKPEKKTAKVAAKKGGKARAQGDRSKPGVQAVIVEMLRKASKTHPITKAEILEELVKRFPERRAEGMKATVSSQVPSGLRIEQELIVEKNDKGYWLPRK